MTSEANPGATPAKPIAKLHRDGYWTRLNAWKEPVNFASVEVYDAPVAMRPVILQERVQPWLLACFGTVIAGDKEERNHRFLEESLELVQACGCTASEAHQLVDYVYGRPTGERDQEVGGVMITLAALCIANGLDMHQAGERELARIWTMVEKIRAKQAAKPKHSPLPAAGPKAAVHAGSDPIELRGIAETLDEGQGIWLTCSGCHESNEGHPTGPYSDAMRCTLGMGCSECGGIGAVWDTTDYNAMADAMWKTMDGPATTEMPNDQELIFAQRVDNLRKFHSDEAARATTESRPAAVRMHEFLLTQVEGIAEQVEINRRGKR